MVMRANSRLNSMTLSAFALYPLFKSGLLRPTYQSRGRNSFKTAMHQKPCSSQPEVTISWVKFKAAAADPVPDLRCGLPG